MLKKKHRLKKEDFASFFKEERRRFSKNFLFLKRACQSDFKISVSISKKVYKKACQRNQARRMVYRILKEKEKEIPNIEMIMIITKPILNFKRGELVREIGRMIGE